MRKYKQEITDRAAQESILNKAHICRLGLCEDRIPYVVPVCFGYEDTTSTFIPRAKGKAGDHQRNNKRCFEMEAEVEIIPGERRMQMVRTLSERDADSAKHTSSMITKGKIQGLNAIMKNTPVFPNTLQRKSHRSCDHHQIEIESMTERNQKLERNRP